MCNSTCNLNAVPIIPEMKLGELLAAYPQTEALIEQQIPSVASMRTAAIRHTVLRTLTLEQAAHAASVNLPDLILKLRSTAGLVGAEAASVTSIATAPDWVKSGSVADSLDARSMLSRGEHPKGMVVSALEKLTSGQYFLLITPFVPGPLIEFGRSLGCQTWTRQSETGKFETYFGKP